MSIAIPSQASDRVQGFFRRLCEECDFRVINSSFSPESFGNIQAVASNQLYDVDYRFDRGDESLYVVVDDRDYLVTDAMRLLEGKASDGVSIATEENWLLVNAKKLGKLLSNDERARSIESFENMRIERLHRMLPGAIAES